MTALDELREGWDDAAQRNAMGYILTTGQAWNPETFFAHGRKEIHDIFERLDFLDLRGPSRKRALDFGCGVGRLTQALAEEYDTVIGLDIAPSMVDQARELNRHGDRVTYQASETLPKGPFDLIYTNLVLQHMPHEFAHDYIRGFIAALSPGGLAVFEIPDGPDTGHQESFLAMYSTHPQTVKEIVKGAGGEICDWVMMYPPDNTWRQWVYSVRHA